MESSLTKQFFNSAQDKAALSSVVPTGIYRHYKGKQYNVFGVIRHSETEEPLVLYGMFYPQWARPLSNFVDTVEIDGVMKPRFELVATMSMRWSLA